MSIGDQASKSIEEQNKYLYNYIHKLEFLIKQSQQERADSALNFKRVIGHLVLEATKSNIEPQITFHELKRILAKEYEDGNVYLDREKLEENPDKRDFVLEALAAGSKPFNNYESGYVPTHGIRTKTSLEPKMLQWSSTKRTDIEADLYASERLKVERVRRLCNTSRMNGGSNADDKRSNGNITDTPSDIGMNNDKSLNKILEETNQANKLIEHHSK